MFLGRYQHSLDDKGRLIVPSRYRDLLASDGAYILQGLDRNLVVVTVPGFERFSSQVMEMSATDPTSRQLKRLIFSTAERVEVDKVGRILIPAFLRKWAELDSDVMIIGAGTYFEIWSLNNWVPQNALIEDADANAQRFAGWDLTF